MTVLMVTERNVVRGYAAVMPMTPTGYADAGHQVHLVSCHDIPGVEETIEWHKNVRLYRRRLPMARSLRALKKWRPTLPLHNALLTVLFCVRALRECRRVLLRHHVDVVYGYEVYGVLAAHLVKALWARDAVVVSRYQGTKLYPHLRSLVRKLLLFEHYLALKLPGDISVMTNDGTFGDRVLRVLNPGGLNLHFLLNGLDTAKPAPPEVVSELRKKHGCEDRFVCVTVSRLTRWKRVDRSIDAIALLDPAIRDRVRLLVLGYGDERGRLEARAREVGVAALVDFAGYIPNDEIYRYLRMSDVFLSFYELSNLGNPLLEALRAGRAIVTLDNGGTRSVIHHRQNGLLLSESRDVVPEIAAAITALMTDLELRQRLEANAAAYAAEHIWSWNERMAREVQAVEEEVERRHAAHAGRARQARAVR